MLVQRLRVSHMASKDHPCTRACVGTRKGVAKEHYRCDMIDVWLYSFIYIYIYIFFLSDPVC